MRIFTLGKNGIPLFFFALFLFSGTYSYGQDCPTVENSTQYFCDSQEAEVGDLVATPDPDSTGEIRWYTDQTSTTPIPSTTILVSGTYYAGTSLNDCQNNRAAVTVVITSEPEILGIRASSTPASSANRKQSLAVIGVCVADVNNPGLTIDDLRTNAGNENNVRWYSSRTSTEPIASGTPLQNNTDYFAAVYSPDGDCETNRRKTTVRFFSEAAPTGPSSQEFCAIDEPTLADIDASGNNRYFSTATSQTELGANTPLVDGRTYYISSLGEDCESTERLAVTVSFNEADAGSDNLTAQACLSEIQSRLDANETPEEIFLSLLDEGVPTNGIFSPGIEELAEQYNDNPIGTFSTTYTVTNETGCQDSADLMLEIFEDPNAGEDVTVEVCASDFEGMSSFEAIQYFIERFEVNPDDYDPEGFDQTELLNLASQFDPQNPVGEYSATYTETNGSCTDEAVITVHVLTSPYAGEDTSIEVDLGDAPVDLFQVLVDNSSEAPNSGGTWSSGDGTFNPSTDAAGDFIYTVTNENGCSHTATVTITVNEDTVPEADIFVLLCEDQIDPNPSVSDVQGYFLSQVTNNTDLPATGTFNPTAEEILEQYQSNPIGTLNTTYTVDVDGQPTSVTIEVQIDELQTAEAGEIANITVEETSSEIISINETLLSDAATRGGVFTAEAGVLNGDGNFDPAIGAGVYTITYTVDGSQFCVEGQDSTSFTITVTEETPQIPVVNVLVCSEEITNPSLSGFRTYFRNQVDVRTDLPEGGTFNPSIQQLFDQYQNSPYGMFETTYTVSTDNGEESVVISVEVVESQSAEAGSISNWTVTEGDAIVVLDDTILSSDATQGGTFSAEDGVLNAEGNFDPAIGPGIYSITYTVNNQQPCVTGEDSVTFSITVTEETQNEADVLVVLCEDEIDANPSLDDVEEFFLNQVTNNTDLPATGTFSPNAEELLAQYSESPIGSLITTYTVDVDGVETSILIEVQILAIQTAEAGAISNIEVACNAGIITLNDSLLDDNATPGGTFTAAEGVLTANGNFDPSIGAGEYEITYSIDESTACVEGTDSTTFTITVVEGDGELEAINFDLCSSEVDPDPTASSVRAYFTTLIRSNTDLPLDGTFSPTSAEILESYLSDPIGAFTTTYSVDTECGTVSVEVTVNVLESLDAGENATVTLTEEDTEIVDLFDELGGTPDEDGTWTDAEGNEVDGLFDPTTDEAGVFTYTVVSENGCEDSATVTVVFEDDQTPCTEFPDAPTVTETFTACVVDGSTVADLDITVEDGNTYAVYTDETLETPAADEDLLTSGEYYVTQINAAGCESEEAAVITVTLTDNDAPTISQGGSVFCEFDNATIADLEENVSANGVITWYASATGTDALTAATVLQNNTTYYAASTGADSDCESSERLAVTVTLEICEIVIPEAFSPNGDQINDYFSITNISSEYPNHRVEIYNRWGDMVYNGRGDNPGWDGSSSEGSFGSNVLPVGVYFYILYFNDGQTAPTQGRVYLSR